MKACTRTTSKKIFCFAALLVLASYVGFAANAKLEDILNHQYKDRIYTLRQPMTAPTQQYDSLGNSPTASAVGPWTIYGRVLIKKIKLEPNRVVVEAQRIGMKFDGGTGALVPIKLKNTVTLEISVIQPMESAEQFHAILGRIFAFSREDFIASLPDFWRVYAQHYLKTYSGDGTTIEFGISEATLKTRKEPPSKTTVEGEQLGPSHRVTAPQPKSVPDPEYTQAASALGLRGTVVLRATIDETGRMGDVYLVRPLGLGLDESAAMTVKNWVFNPGTKDGSPVKVELTVEVAFRQ